MGDKELGGLEFGGVHSTGFHELHCAIDVGSNRLVLLVCRAFGETLVPGVNLTKICKTTGGECSNQIQRAGRCVVGLHQSAWVIPSGLSGEFVAVDSITAVGGESYSLASFIVRGAWLRKLPSHATHLDHWQRRSVHQHHCHLQHGLDSVSDAICGCIDESLGAISTL